MDDPTDDFGESGFCIQNWQRWNSYSSQIPSNDAVSLKLVGIYGPMTSVFTWVVQVFRNLLIYLVYSEAYKSNLKCKKCLLWAVLFDRTNVWVCLWPVIREQAQNTRAG